MRHQFLLAILVVCCLLPRTVKADDDVLVRENRPDIEKVRPFVYSPARRAYHGIGDYLGKGWSIGKELMKPKEE